MSENILETRDLRKTFKVTGGRRAQTQAGKTVEAVKGINLTVKKGEVFGFLGPNGAGKTTSLRMLCTLLPIDEGEATIAGFDVRKQPGEVRKHVGYVSQLGGADDEATGREDLVLQGRLCGMNEANAKKRAAELIKLLQLEEFADRKVGKYSGGQKRRLDVATGIIHKPDILFLDEPSTGLDPQNRANLWDQIRMLRDQGTTIFLTTHYLEEADNLSDRLAIMDHGQIVAEGTPHELKKQVAGDAITIRPKRDGLVLEKVREQFDGQPFVREARLEGEDVRLYVDDGAQALPKIFALLEAKNISLETVSLSQPSLDDVFLKQTGRSLRDAGNHQKGADK